MQEIEGVQKKKEKFSYLSFKTWGKDKFLILILIGILLFIIAIPVDSKKQEANETKKGLLTDEVPLSASEDNYHMAENTEAYEENNEQELYVKRLEQRLEYILGYMQGAGNVRVMITLRSSEEKIVEKDIPSSRTNTTEKDAEGGNRNIIDMTSEESTVYATDEAGVKMPYVVKRVEPTIEGVVVMAEGGGNAEVSKQITEAVQALFNIEVHKIRVIQMRRQ